ncbi:AraC family transcriptional regulator [uncultured Kriegella sp.]|uniref:AraC family transcriptional regulator n=1 Tax=uncultured Kriegella sp. TaxID=1798910 RepID=UPI0030DC2C3F
MENKYHCSIIEKAIYFITENYRSQPTLEEVSDYVCLSKYHFQRLFHQWVGVSPKQFLQFTTVEHAKKCLEAGRTTLATAYEVGLSGNGRLHSRGVWKKGRRSHFKISSYPNSIWGDGHSRI